MVDILGTTTLSFFSLLIHLPSFMSPFLITSDSLRPDLLLLTESNALYILELTLGYETNIQDSSVRKTTKLTPLLQYVCSCYNRIIFTNVSMDALGVMGSSCDSFLTLLKDLNLTKLYREELF